jgi:plastocyanin
MNPTAAWIAIVAIANVTMITPATAEVQEIGLAIRDHRFQPEEVRVPAGRKVRLVVRNFDATAEEFESHELNREKLIAAGASAVVYIGPLDAGRYPFIGEFHDATARGVLVAE